MKFGELKSIGHNVAHSLASGLGLPLGHYESDIFGEARKSPAGFITVDFLAGTYDGEASAKLTQAIKLYQEVLSDFCSKHGTSPDVFRVLNCMYSTKGHLTHFTVTVEDQNGHKSVNEFQGFAGKKVMALDSLGRLRPKRGS